MVYDLVPALRPREWRSTICVRVCRKWEYRGGTDDGPIQHVDLVLVDERGNSIYGEIPAAQVESKSPLIEEGSIYVISRFRVSNAKSAYRPVACRYMVEFTLRTTVSAPMANIPDFPRYAYRITPLSELPSHAGDTRDFVDTIGILVEKSDAYMVHLPNKPAATLTRHIILRDIRYSEMKVTLWGDRAAAFNTEGVNTDSRDRPIVVLFVGGLMKSYQGTYYVSANTASRWYFNPDIPEARQFYDSYRNQLIQVRTVAAPQDQSAQNQVVAAPEEKTLRELNEMDPYEFAENGYRCSVTIGRLVPNVSWWFASCSRCSKSCVVDGSTYRCNACSTDAYRFKYKVSFVALDGTDEAEMICFGDTARKMIGKSVQQILRNAGNPNGYPADITRLVSLRFTFHIVLTQQSFYREQKSYQVVSVITSHGQPDAAPPAPGTGGGGGTNSPGSTQSLTETTTTEMVLATPSSVNKTTAVSMVLTPSTAAAAGETPPPTDKTSAKSGKVFEPSARKRLEFPSDDEQELQDKLPEDALNSGDQDAESLIDDSDHTMTKSSPVKTKPAETKRARRGSALLQKSG